MGATGESADIGEDRRSGVERFVRWVADYWGPTVSIAGGLLTAVAGALEGTVKLVLTVIGALGIAVASVLEIRNRPRVTQLRRSADALREQVAENGQLLSSLLRVILVSIARDLDFSPRERVSIYLHSGTSFVRIARYSPDPILSDAPGRATYPETEGVVGRAWREKTSSVTDLPDANEDLDAYCAAVASELGIDVETCRQLSMKSRSLACIRFPESDIREPLGVIAFESLDPRGVHASTLTAVASSSNWPLLIDYMYGNRAQLPNLGEARRRGF